MNNTPCYEYDFSISVAGEDIKVARQIYSKLTTSGYRVFLAASMIDELCGASGTKEFQRIFSYASRFVVPIISKSYINKEWTKLEWDIIRKEEKRRNEKFVLPIRLDDSILLGLSDDVIYLDRRVQPVKKIVDTLSQIAQGSIFEEPCDDWVICFGLLVEEAISVRKLENKEPWVVFELLTDELSKALGSRFEYIDSMSNGECMSARFRLDLTDIGDVVDRIELPEPWELLEVVAYDEVFPS